MADIKRVGRKPAAPKPITGADIERFYANKKELDRLKDENDRISARIKAQFDPDTYEVEGFIIKLTKTIGTIKTDVFERDYPHGDFPELYEPKPSTEAIKEYLGEEREEYYSPVLRLTISAKAS